MASRAEGPAGVYLIRHPASGRCYVGSTLSMKLRWREHQRALARGGHHSIVLQRAWNKYGAGAFEFRPLLICKPEHLLFYEQRAIDVLKPDYNIAKRAGSQLGYKHSPETIAKMKQAAVGRPSSFRGFKHSAESNHKNRLARIGKKRGPYSAEHRRAISESQRGKVIPHEQRLKISATLTGRSTGRGKLSPEQVRQIRSLRAGGLGRIEIARTLGIHRRQVNTVLGNHGYTWVN